MKHITLNDKVRMPALGLGTWKAHGDIVIQAIINAIKMGYRHIDTAMIYDNEVEVGQAITQAIDLGLCRREIYSLPRNFGTTDTMPMMSFLLLRPI